MRSDWDAQFSLNNKKRLPFRLFAVGAERDEFVPFESSLGPFPDDAYPECRYVVPGNHLQIVKPESADSASVRLVVNGLVGAAAPGGPWNAARVAVESLDFQRALDLLEPEKDSLDQDGLVRLALALEGVGRSSDAIELLTERGKLGTDAMSVLAGRLKRRWLLTQREDDAQRAQALYREALALARAAGDAAQVLLPRGQSHVLRSGISQGRVAGTGARHGGAGSLQEGRVERVRARSEMAYRHR